MYNQQQTLVQTLLSSKSMSKPEKDKMLARLQGLYTDIDVEYLHALYFPETSHAARIPSRFGMPSSVFTQRFSFYLNTGADGKGFAGIAPQDTTFKCCFYSTSSLENEIDQNLPVNTKFKFIGESSEYIPENFSYARLVGCSYRVSYIGTREDESGFLAASHVFSTMPHLIDEQMIENGFFCVRKKPCEGVRMCFLPKDDADLEYEPQEFKLNPTASDIEVGITNWLQDKDGDGIVADGADDHTVLTRQLGAPNASGNRIVGWYPLQANANPRSPSHYWGIHNGKGQNQTPHMMAFYWRGMPANRDWIRVDVERHWEGIPREHLRDLVATKRRGPSQKTIDFVKNKSAETKLHTHDLDDHEVMKDVIKPAMAHAVTYSDIVKTTPKEDKGWMSKAGDFLSSAGTAMGNVLGDSLPTIGSLVGTVAGGALGARMGNPMLGAQLGGAIGGGVGALAGEAEQTVMGSSQMMGGGTAFASNPVYGTTMMPSKKDMYMSSAIDSSAAAGGSSALVGQVAGSQQNQQQQSTAATQFWATDFDPSLVQSVNAPPSQIARFKTDDVLGSTNLIQQFMAAREKETRKTRVDKGSAMEYLKPLIPKRYLVTKKQTYGEQSSFSWNFVGSSYKGPPKFYMSMSQLPPQNENWFHTTHNANTFTVSGEYNSQGNWSEITWSNIKLLVTRETNDINDAIDEWLKNNSIRAIALKLGSMDEEVNFSAATDFTGSNRAGERFDKGVLDRQLASNTIVYQSLNLFTGLLKTLYTLKFTVGGPFSDDGIIELAWKNSFLVTAGVPQDSFRFGNNSYVSAHSWYESRAMQKLNEISKLVMKPMTLDLGRVYPTRVFKRMEIPTVTGLTVYYDTGARRTFQENLKAVGAAADSYLQNVMKDRVIVLEPETRTINRYKLMDDFARAKQRWASSRKSTSGKSELENFISPAIYEKIKTGLAAEVDSVYARSTSKYFLEWPTTKIGNFSFIKSVQITYITFNWSQILDNAILGGISDVEQTVSQIVDGPGQNASINYSLVSKFVWERTTPAPTLERVQFTTNLKSTYYMKQVLQSRTLRAPASLVYKDVGLILRKKQRAQLKAVIQQSTLTYAQITMPFVQSALHWFKIYDTTSMNLRRLTCFTLFYALDRQFTSFSDYRGNPWLVPLRTTKEPRYVVAAGKSGNLVDLDMWHDAYKHLAESGIRSTVRKKLQKIFKYMKRMQKVSAVFQDRAQMRNSSATAVKQFQHANDTTLAVFGVFFLCAELGRTPTYMGGAGTAAKGFHVHNIAGAQRFSEMIRNTDSVMYGGDMNNPNYKLVFETLVLKFINGMKTRKITMGVSENGIDPLQIDPIGGNEADYESLLQFCRAYYPGVSTLASNMIHLQRNQQATSLFEYMKSNRYNAAQRLDVILNLAMFFELFETGFILLQTFNTAYYKNISDYSFGLLTTAWFWMIEQLAKSIKKEHVHLPPGQEFSQLYEPILKSIGALAVYTYTDLIRIPRADRVSSKTKKKPEEYLLFFGLRDLVGDFYSQRAMAIQSYDRDKTDARRGTELNLDSVRNIGQSDVYNKLDEIKDAVLLQRKKTQGTYLGKRRGGRSKVASLPMTDAEKQRHTQFTQNLLSGIGEGDAQVAEEPEDMSAVKDGRPRFINQALQQTFSYHLSYNPTVDLSSIHVPHFLSEVVDSDYIVDQLIHFLKIFKLIPYNALNSFGMIRNVYGTFMSTQRYPKLLQRITFFTFDDPAVKEQFMRKAEPVWTEATEQILTEPDTGYSFDRVLIEGQSEHARGIAESPYSLKLRLKLRTEVGDLDPHIEDPALENELDNEALRLIMAVRFIVSRIKSNYTYDPWIFLQFEQWQQKSLRFHPYTKAGAKLWITCQLLLRFGFDPYSKGVLRLGTYLVQYALDTHYNSLTEIHLATVHFLLVFRTVQLLSYEDKELSPQVRFHIKVNALSRCTYLTWFATEDMGILWRLTDSSINDLQSMNMPVFKKFSEDPRANFVPLNPQIDFMFGDWSDKMYLQVWMGTRDSLWPIIYVPKVVAFMYWITVSLQFWKGDKREITDAQTAIQLISQSEFKNHIALAFTKLELGLAAWYERVLPILHEARGKETYTTVHGLEGPSISYYLYHSFIRLNTYWFRSYTVGHYGDVVPQLVHLSSWVPFAPKLPTHIVFVPPMLQIARGTYERFRNFYRKPRFITDDRRDFQLAWNRFYSVFMLSELKFDERDLAVTIAFLQSMFYKDKTVAEYMYPDWQSNQVGTDESVQRAFFQPIEIRPQGQQTGKEFAMQVEFQRSADKRQKTDNLSKVMEIIRFYVNKTRPTQTAVGDVRELAVTRPGAMALFDELPRTLQQYLIDPLQANMLHRSELGDPQIVIRLPPAFEHETELDDWFNDFFTPLWQKIFQASFPPHHNHISEDLKKLNQRVKDLDDLLNAHPEQDRQQLRAEYWRQIDLEDREEREARDEYYRNTFEVKLQEQYEQYKDYPSYFGHVLLSTVPYRYRADDGQYISGHYIFFRADARFVLNDLALLHVRFSAEGLERLQSMLDQWQYVWRKWLWIEFKNYYREHIYEDPPDRRSKQLVYDVWERVNPGWKRERIHESVFSYPNVAIM